jgi:hypothetical protein
MDIIRNCVNVTFCNLMVSTNVILICQVSIPLVRAVGVSGKESLDRSFSRFQSCDLFESCLDVMALSCVTKEEPNVRTLNMATYILAYLRSTKCCSRLERVRMTLGSVRPYALMTVMAKPGSRGKCRRMSIFDGRKPWPPLAIVGSHRSRFYGFGKMGTTTLPLTRVMSFQAAMDFFRSAFFSGVFPLLFEGHFFIDKDDIYCSWRLSKSDDVAGLGSTEFCFKEVSLGLTCRENGVVGKGSGFYDSFLLAVIVREEAISILNVVLEKGGIIVYGRRSQRKLVEAFASSCGGKKANGWRRYFLIWQRVVTVYV